MSFTTRIVVALLGILASCRTVSSVPRTRANVAPTHHLVSPGTCFDTTRVPPLSYDAVTVGAVVYDLARDRVVYVPGVRNAPPDARFETWEWDGRCWHAMPITHGPTPRYGHALAYDVRRSRTVLFGGIENNTVASFATGTWEWNGIAWTRAETASEPPSRVMPGMVYDPAHGVTMVTGGTTNVVNETTIPRPPRVMSELSEVSVPGSDVWAWDGRTWERLPDVPMHRIGELRMFYRESAETVFVYDPTPGQLLRLDNNGWSHVGSTGDAPPNWMPCLTESSAPHMCMNGLDLYTLNDLEWTHRRMTMKPMLIVYDPRQHTAIGFGMQSPQYPHAIVSDSVWVFREWDWHRRGN
jgi:hypothetical protein